MKFPFYQFVFFFVFCSVFAQKKSVHNISKTDSLGYYLDVAYDYDNKEDSDNAILYYKKAIALDSTVKMAYYNICLIYANSKREKEAIAFADKALQSCYEELESFYLLQANCYSGINEFEKALPLYHKILVITQNESYKNLNYNLGYTYYKLNQYESAILYLNQYLTFEDKEKGNYSDALFYVGTSCSQLKRYPEALKYLDSAIADNNYYSYYINKGEVLSLMGKNNEAIEVLDFAIKQFPANDNLYHKRYQIYLEMDKKDKAYIDLNKAYTLNAKNGDVLLDMGVMYERDNKVELSKKMYHKCITYKVNIDGAYGNLANLYSKNETTKDSALYYYQKSIIHNPKDATKYYNYGNFYKSQKENQLATAMYLKALELQPDLGVAFTNLSILNVEENPKKALEYALKSYELAPKNLSVLGLLTTLYFNEGQYIKAIEFATDFIRLQSSKYKSTDILLKRGISRQVLGEYTNAQYDYLDVISLYTDVEKKANPSVFSNVGYCFLEDNQLDNALKYFNEAIVYAPETDQLIGQFTVYYLKNDKKEFDKSLTLAKKIEPKLKKGFEGILELEKVGYFYTPKHKDVLRNIFSK